MRGHEPGDGRMVDTYAQVDIPVPDEGECFDLKAEARFRGNYASRLVSARVKRHAPSL